MASRAELVPEAADRSYGIQVARLAGLPEPVLHRARQVLTILEQRSVGTASSSQKASVLDDLPLFAHQPAPRGRRGWGVADLDGQAFALPARRHECPRP